jgi:trehalose 6-phosphate synthase/phosphatase
MNLISKEFLATKLDRKGVLILSEMAGAANELGEAIIVNPNNKEEVARSLKDALEMSEDEQIERNWTMQMRLQRYDIGLWASDFLTGLTNVKCVQNQLRAKRLTGKMKKKLVADYRKSVNRLILLDHDGTLVPFTTEPEQARPDRRLLRWLSALGDNRQNELVIVSGRARDVLDRWFGGLGIGLIAEHGVWLARKPGKWEMLETITNDWKDKVRPILELHVDRTPNTFIEEKDYSLAWHYRKADIELAKIRARELKDAVLQHAANLNLGVLEGSKVIEVKNAGINKGQAARRWLSKRKWDFVLAIGDDWTDENTFAELPESAYSIKVGWAPTRARFNVDSVVDARQLLQELVGG